MLYTYIKKSLNVYIINARCMYKSKVKKLPCYINQNRFIGVDTNTDH